MIYRRWQIAAIVFACLLGAFLALPNVSGPGLLRYLPFAQQIFLGLDLKGGTYLQLQVDVAAAEKERAQATLDTMRGLLRTARIQYTDLRAAGGTTVSLRISDPNKI